MDIDFNNRRRLYALFYYSSSAFVSQSIRLVGILVTTWRIGKADFATYASALMLVGFCNMLRDLGQDPALISLPVLRKGFIRCHLLLSVGLSFLAATVLSLLIWCTPWFTDLRSIYLFLPALILIEAGYHTAQIACLRRFGAGIFGLSWKKDILDLWWWALPLCIVRPLMWNFLISFESTGGPSLLLSSIIVNTCLSILLGALLIIPFGARGALRGSWAKPVNDSAPTGFMVKGTHSLLRQSDPSGCG